ncbi:choice-of-anchor I family protein [Paenibacillus sp. NFR01]|uniref:choice-of-anchor I family protein n=1 Tax=Paenibacillus sp. NFR01 TaxID=1566279 RepID=UPI0008AC7636|nr:choice-of-anchor I family protein [Paenibacillus sp. NFR01]SES94840.1 S-layer homology domain-containing protein [Paenibacillus sp. NFR01]
MKKRTPKQLISAAMAAVLLFVILPVSGKVSAEPAFAVAEWNFTAQNSEGKSVIPATGGVNAGTSTVTWSTYNGNARTVSYSATDSAIYATGWDGSNDTKYWQVNTSTKWFEDLKLSFSLSGSDTGPSDFKLQYSLDNKVYSDIPGSSLHITAAGSVSQTDLPLPAEINDQAAVYLRLLQTGDISVGGGTVGAEGTSGLAAVKITGDAIPVSSGTLMSKIAGYSTGFSSDKGGVAEIVKYNSDNQKFYLVNGSEKKVDIVGLSGLKSGGNAALQLEKRIDVSQMIQGFTFGDITSVDINTSLKRIAIAVQEADYSKAGAVILLDYDGNFQDSYATGVQPDMVTFTPDSKYLLTADEGEPRQGYAAPAVDPKGSVTIVDLTTHTAKVVDFTSFDDTNARAGLLADHVILKKNTAPSVDLEPEYAAISADSKKAYITLQEANAIATLDIEKGEFTAIKGLGFKDHSLPGNEIDIRRDGKINIKTEENYFGMFNPDGIASYAVGGKTYLLTANEGDSRDWNGYVNEKDITISNGGQDGDPSKKMKVTAFDTSGYEVGTNGSGFDSSKTYLFGARSFSVWDADSLQLVYDSGADFENYTAKLLPQYFNWSNDDLVFEKRSAKKGPEPEDVKVGIVDGKPYAFIGLERVGGNMMYDLSNIHKPVFADYLNTRDFPGSVDNTGKYAIAGDVSPEGQAFIPANLSPTRYPLLLVANEVSGTVSVVQVSAGLYTPPTPTPTPTQQPTGPQSPVSSATPSPAASPSATSAAGTTAVIKPSFNSETGEAKLTLNAETAAKLLANAAVSEQAGRHAVVEISSEAMSNAKKVSLELGSNFLQKLAADTNADFKLNTGFGTITLGNAAADAIGKSAQGQPISVSVEAAATGNLSTGVQALIGDRPVYSFTITAGTSNITTFGGEALKVTIPYTPKAGENPNAILVYYIDGSGNAVPVTSKYNAATQTAEFATTHFSTFAVAYNPITFADTANHWGKDSIAFMAARGVLTGLSTDQFGPNQTMTRGMLATVLGKLASVTPASAASFSDVSAAKYYAPYVAWAVQNNIVKGTGNGKFAPDQAVTRQELAVVLYNYLAYSGGKLSTATTVSEFTDAGSIAAWAKEAVSAIQAGGLISGKPGNTFDPLGTATRAEVASVLQKYIGQSLAN